MNVQEMANTGDLFRLFAHSGTSLSLDVLDQRPGLVEAVGGCAPLGEASLGTGSNWAKVATLKMHVRRAGRAVLQTSPSHGAYGVSIVNRFGDLDSSQIEFNGTELRLRGAVPDLGSRSPKSATWRVCAVEGCHTWPCAYSLQTQ